MGGPAASAIGVLHPPVGEKHIGIAVTVEIADSRRVEPGVNVHAAIEHILGDGRPRPVRFARRTGRNRVPEAALAVAHRDYVGPTIAVDICRCNVVNLRSNAGVVTISLEPRLTAVAEPVPAHNDIGQGVGIDVEHRGAELNPGKLADLFPLPVVFRRLPKQVQLAVATVENGKVEISVAVEVREGRGAGADVVSGQFAGDVMMPEGVRRYVSLQGTEAGEDRKTGEHSNVSRCSFVGRDGILHGGW